MTCNHSATCTGYVIAEGKCEQHLVAGSKPVSAKPITRRQRKKGPKGTPKSRSFEFASQSRAF
jgi:hypothetical protein